MASDGFGTDRNGALYQALQDGGLETARNLLIGEDLHGQTKALEMLRASSERVAYELLLDFIQDIRGDLAASAVVTFASIGDSRALFPLINLFSQRGPSFQKAVLNYLLETRDPRSENFLEDYLAGDGEFSDLASAALGYCRGNFDFSYRFAGREEMLERALEQDGGILVTPENLDTNEQVMLENDPKPQTYIVGLDGKLLIGGLVNEHVEVAKGRDVVAAGEIIFEKDGEGLWQVSYVNNRSNGYFPGRSSFYHVNNALAEQDMHFDKTSFDRAFPREGYNDQEFLSLIRFGENY